MFQFRFFIKHATFSTLAPKQELMQKGKKSHSSKSNTSILMSPILDGENDQSAEGLLSTKVEKNINGGSKEQNTDL